MLIKINSWKSKSHVSKIIGTGCQLNDTTGEVEGSILWTRMTGSHFRCGLKSRAVDQAPSEVVPSGVPDDYYWRIMICHFSPVSLNLRADAHSNLESRVSSF